MLLGKKFSDVYCIWKTVDEVKLNMKFEFPGILVLLQVFSEPLRVSLKGGVCSISQASLLQEVHVCMCVHTHGCV